MKVSESDPLIDMIVLIDPKIHDTIHSFPFSVEFNIYSTNNQNSIKINIY
jgi:hypothetical protein